MLAVAMTLPYSRHWQDRRSNQEASADSVNTPSWDDRRQNTTRKSWRRRRRIFRETEADPRVIAASLSRAEIDGRHLSRIVACARPISARSGNYITTKEGRQPALSDWLV
jgi:hypothetical protein